MISGIRFTKAQALGNDFAIIDDRQGTVSLSESEIVALCDRRRGIGADGILLLQPSTAGAFLMRTLNSDGTEAEMCGNGIRCAAKYAYDTGLSRQTEIPIETKAGLRTVEIVEIEDGHATTIRVDLGLPDFERAHVPMAGPAGEVILEPLAIGETSVDITALSIGNPHAVTFVGDAMAAAVAVLGPAIERHPAFPARTNVEFTEVISRNHLRLRVWERGAGETDACGTGAAAAVVAAHRAGLAERRARVSLPGGDLDVEWAESGRIFITGGAALVYTGTTGDGS